MLAFSNLGIDAAELIFVLVENVITLGHFCF